MAYARSPSEVDEVNTGRGNVFAQNVEVVAIVEGVGHDAGHSLSVGVK